MPLDFDMKPLHAQIAQLQSSKIRDVANAGLGRSDVLAFWFGESDQVTPDVVRQSAIESLQQGETFYTHNLGMPELREDRKSTRLNSSHSQQSRMPSSA